MEGRRKKKPRSGNLMPLVVYGENQIGTVNCSDIIHYHRSRQKNGRWPIKYFDVAIPPSVSTSEYTFYYVMDKKAVYQICSSEHIKTSLNLFSSTKIPVILLSGCLRNVVFTCSCWNQRKWVVLVIFITSTKVYSHANNSGDHYV